MDNKILAVIGGSALLIGVAASPFYNSRMREVREDMAQEVCHLALDCAQNQEQTGNVVLPYVHTDLNLNGTVGKQYYLGCTDSSIGDRYVCSTFQENSTGDRYVAGDIAGSLEGKTTSSLHFIPTSEEKFRPIVNGIKDLLVE